MPSLSQTASMLPCTGLGGCREQCRPACYVQPCLSGPEAVTGSPHIHAFPPSPCIRLTRAGTHSALANVGDTLTATAGGGAGTVQ